MITVLYVDDESALLTVGSSFLERQGGLSVVTAESAKAGLATLASQPIDVIVSDYQMPGMDGIRFLKEVRGRFGDLPFILFTGKGREEVVIEAINNGADFYLQKGGEPRSQFAELAHKIRQADRRHRAELDLIRSEEKFSKLFVNNPSLEAISDFATGRLIDVNEAWVRTSGYTRDEVIGKSTRDLNIFIDFEDRERMAQALIKDGIIHCSEVRIRTKSGGIHTLEFAGQRIMVGDHDLLFSQAIDITERKQASEELQASYQQLTAQEEELRQQYDKLARNQQDLQERETAYRTIFEQSPVAIILSTMDGEYIDVNERFCELFKKRREEVIGKKPEDLWPADNASILTNRQVFNDSRGRLDKCEMHLPHSDGQPLHCRVSTRIVPYHGKAHVLAILYKIGDGDVDV